MMRLCSGLVFAVAAILCTASAPTVVIAGEAERAPAAAQPSDGLTVPLLAEGFSIGRWFSGSGGRARVVQFCVATMVVALFIMMRKLR
jgi:hypothetical protein